MLLSTEDAGLERLFREYLQTLPKDEKHVLFFDEMPWLDTPRSDFLPAFEYFWNNWGSAQDNLVCLVCGSACISFPIILLCFIISLLNTITVKMRNSGLTL